MFGNDAIHDLRPSYNYPEAMEFCRPIIKKGYDAAQTGDGLDGFSLRVNWPNASTKYPLTAFDPIEGGARLYFRIKKWYDITGMFLWFGGIPIYMFSWSEILEYDKFSYHLTVNVFVDINESWLETWKPV